MNVIGNSYDNILQDEENQAMPNERFKSVDNEDKEVLMTTFKPRVVQADDELFIVFVKHNRNTVIFSLDEVYDKTNQYLVHAEDISDFVFDEKDKELVWSAEPVLGKDLM